MKAMQKAAKELNQKLGLDPAIKIVGNTKTTMRDQLIQSAALILEDDDITDETLELLATLSAEEEEVKETPPTKKKAAPKAKKKEEEEEEEEEWDEEEEEEEEEAPAKKTPTKKAPAKEKAAPKTKVVKEKKAKALSAYGVSIDILGKNPDISANDLKKEVAKQGIDVEEKNSSITTAYSQFGKVVKVLRAHKHMK